MKTDYRLAVAVHILSLLAVDEPSRCTSEWMAGSIGVNAVIVRNITGMLRRAGLVETQQGVPGARLGRPLERISLLDVYQAVEDSELFGMHPNPNPACPVGSRIQDSLERAFAEARQAMKNRLAAITLNHIVQDLKV